MSGATGQIAGAVSAEQASWIGANVCIGAAFGPFAAGYLAQRMGKKSTLLFGSFSFLMGWLIIATTENVVQLYMSRVILGVGVGFAFAIFPIYTAEISEVSPGWFGWAAC